MGARPSPRLGLWGTSTAKRIAVTPSSRHAAPVLRHIVEVYGLRWAVECDRERSIFKTRREGVEYGYSPFWGNEEGRDGNSTNGTIGLAKYRCVLLLEVTVKPPRTLLGRIDGELRDVQRHFSSINAILNLRRDDFTDAVRQNMLAAYEFLDAVVRDGLDPFSDPGLEALLELNRLVLLGRD